MEKIQDKAFAYKKEEKAKTVSNFCQSIEHFFHDRYDPERLLKEYATFLG